MQGAILCYDNYKHVQTCKAVATSTWRQHSRSLTNHKHTSTYSIHK